MAQQGIAETGIDLAPDRRKSQFMNDQGYYVFPMPYSIPGVGAGLGVIGIGMNIGGSYTDLFGFALGGGLSGGGAGITEIHLLPKTLLLDVTAIDFSKSTITNYRKRGMETDKNDFSYLQFNNYGFAGGRLTATFVDRRFEIYGGGYKIGSELDKVLDQNKNTLLAVEGSPKWRASVYGLGVRGDLTDDYYDPRKGFRMDVSRWWSPPARSSDPDFYRIEYNASAYLPLGKRSTWVFNYFRSDAHVNRQGETNPLVIEKEQGLNCSDPALTAAGKGRLRKHHQQHHRREYLRYRDGPRRHEPSSLLSQRPVFRRPYGLLRHRAAVDTDRGGPSLRHLHCQGRPDGAAGGPVLRDGERRRPAGGTGEHLSGIVRHGFPDGDRLGDRAAGRCGDGERRDRDDDHRRLSLGVVLTSS